MISIFGDHEPYVFPDGFDNGMRLKDLLEDEVDEKFYISGEKVEKLISQLDGRKTDAFGVAIPCLMPDRVEKRQNGRRFKEDGDPMFTLTGQDRHGVMVKQATKQGYDIAYEYDSINLEQPNSKTRRGRVGRQIANTLTCGCNQAVVEPNIQNYRIRKLTPRETWRLMGFDDEHFQRATDAGISNSQLYKQAGNSIVVDVLEHIFMNLFEGERDGLS